ncbi:efflux RND transporter periplasmic adaptor subunit [Rhodobacteraceae bacterium LMO-12]|nr:efflux RND transporter periplasmic adaptor subunit [Rhodobacteraceae bacterium LMO-JJ12]
MKKRIFLVIVLLTAMAVGIIGFDSFRSTMISEFFANRQIPPVTAPVYEVKPRDWTPVISAIGTIDAKHGVELTVEAAGIIKALNFAANDNVKKDSLLIRLDDTVQIADLEAQRTQARLDEQALERTRELQGRGIRSGVSLDEAEARAETSRAQVAKLQAVVATKRLLAPFDGTIGIPRVDVGSYVAPGTIIATLQDLNSLYVDFKVAEQQFGLVSNGQKVRVMVKDGAPALEGRIAGIDPKIDAATRLGSVRAEVVAGDIPLIPGQFVQVEVQLPTQTNVLAVPHTAIVTSLYGDHVFVLRPVENDAGKFEARQVFVTAGRRSDDIVEIVKGIAPGDRVVIAGQNRLSNGSPVNPDNTVAPLMENESTNSDKAASQ